jgi:hypothetical protein
MNIIKLNSITQTSYRIKHNTNCIHKDKICSITPFRYSRRKYILCQSDKNKKENSNDNSISYDNISHNKNSGLFISSTLVLSSILFLSTSIVLILSAREMNIEAERLQDKYDKLQEAVKHLEEKNIQDEIMINAIVGKM